MSAHDDIKSLGEPRRRRPVSRTPHHHVILFRRTKHAACRPESEAVHLWAAFSWIRSKIPVVSLYEYYDRDNYLITGKSISFEIPREYMNYTAEANGGPQLTIGLTYVRATGQGGKRSLPVSEGERKRADLREDLVLHPYEFSPHALVERDFEKGLTPPGLAGLFSGDRLQRIVPNYCGYQVYANRTPKSLRRKQLHTAIRRMVIGHIKLALHSPSRSGIGSNLSYFVRSTAGATVTHCV